MATGVITKAMRRSKTTWTLLFGCVIIGFIFPPLFLNFGQISLNKENGKDRQDHDLRQFIMHRHLQVKERVREVCSHGRTFVNDVGRLRSDMVNHMVIDTKHRLLYCYIPKVACTNWKRTLLILTGKFNSTDPLTISPRETHLSYMKDLKLLQDVKPEDRQGILNTYFKFAIVRDPLERLLSAFRSKIETLGEGKYLALRRKFEEEIIKNNGNDSELLKKQKKGESIVPFTHFLKFVQKEYKTKSIYYADEHWRNQIELCQPCAMDYDIIGSFKYHDAEADYILKRLGVTHKVTFPKRSKNYHMQKSADVFYSFYNSVSDDLIIEMYQLFRNDYAMFGFQHHTFKRQKLEEYKNKMKKEFCDQYSDKADKIGKSSELFIEDEKSHSPALNCKHFNQQKN